MGLGSFLPGTEGRDLSCVPCAGTKPMSLPLCLPRSTTCTAGGSESSTTWSASSRRITWRLPTTWRRDEDRSTPGERWHPLGMWRGGGCWGGGSLPGVPRHLRGAEPQGLSLAPSPGLHFTWEQARPQTIVAVRGRCHPAQCPSLEFKSFKLHGRNVLKPPQPPPSDPESCV